MDTRIRARDTTGVASVVRAVLALGVASRGHGLGDLVESVIEEVAIGVQRHRRAPASIVAALATFNAEWTGALVATAFLAVFSVAMHRGLREPRGA